MLYEIVMENINYINIIRGWGLIHRPIDFSYEIHSIIYMFNNCKIDTNISFIDSYRIITNFNYGFIFNIEAEDVYHFTPIFSHGLLVIHSSYINCNISREKYNQIINNRKLLNLEIHRNKIKKDMFETTSMIISKCTKTNFYWK